jgi:hypothetical protein
MVSKRLKQLAIGGAVVAALALGSSASAGAATASSSASSSTLATQQEADRETPRASTAVRASAREGSVGAMHHVRDGWVHELYLTDHEHYLRHHAALSGTSQPVPSTAQA